MDDPESPGIPNGLPLDLLLPPSFPPDDYTPHGYLDNPHHSMVLNRSGIIRSVPPLGFGYWLRTFKGAYGSGLSGPVNYLALLRVAVACGATRLATTDDFAAAGVTLTSKYHTKHLLSYNWRLGELVFSASYFLPREHTLACLVEITNEGPASHTTHVHAIHSLGGWEQRWWGADGVAMRHAAEPDAALSTIWAYGPCFALGASQPSSAHRATASDDEWQSWVRGNDLTSAAGTSVRGPGPLHTVMTYELPVGPGQRATLLVCLSRGLSEPAALAELQTGLADALVNIEQQLDQDEAFWARCPLLEGDWPAAWKRGWVYDWETLRMTVRPPLGIFRHPWDGMQIHSPRSVLGEASLDALALSHAVPTLAQDVLLGTFADAPAPNVPCCREDGSLNMIAADGQACGTAPSWGLPFRVIRAIYAATRDGEWIAQLYPHLKTYVDWWLAHRTDEHGRMHCHCDWESGQDGSCRFPQGEGGLTDRIHAVDVEAAMADALRSMADFARLAGAPHDIPHWTELAAQRINAARRMFFEGAFRDADRDTNQPIVRADDGDVMMLTPLACNLATPEQTAALAGRIAAQRSQPRPWLEWPSFLLTYVEAAWHARQPLAAAEAIADIADRVYPRLDARTVSHADPDDLCAYRVPGVACEYWPTADDTEPGGEGYGWGATLPLHIIRTIVGVRESDRLDELELHLAPALPGRLLVPGRQYTLRNITFAGVNLVIRYTVGDRQRLRLELEYGTAAPLRLTICDPRGRILARSDEDETTGECSLSVANGDILTLRFTTPA